MIHCIIEIEVMVDPNALNPVLTQEETYLNDPALVVTASGLDKWSVKLKDPPDINELQTHNPLDDDPSLVAYHKYGKGKMDGISPHR